jgi:hypothetical protein
MDDKVIIEPERLALLAFASATAAMECTVADETAVAAQELERLALLAFASTRTVTDQTAVPAKVDSSCAVCLEDMTAATTEMLDCAHVFCSVCVNRLYGAAARTYSAGSVDT